MRTIQGFRRYVTACLAASFALFITACGVGASNPPAPNPITPTLTWIPTVRSVQFGSPLTIGVLDAEASVPGNFIYTTAAGQILNASTILPAGSYTLFAGFTPDDATRYTVASMSIPFQVVSSAASLTWTPSTSTISQGVPLLPAILDATGSVNGSIAYTARSAAGVEIPVTNDTVLAAGTYTMTASLTPSDSGNFKAASKSIPFTVFPVPQVIGASTSAALEHGYNNRFVVDANGTAYFSIHSADGAGNLNNALVQSVSVWNQTAQYGATYLRNFATINVESSPQGAASIATNGDGTVHLVWAGSHTALSDAAYADQIHYARFISGNPPGIKEETVPAAVSGFSTYYTAPFASPDVWQQNPSVGEDSGGNIYIVYEGRDVLPAPPPTCTASASILARGASGFTRSSGPLDTTTPPVSVTIAPVTVSLLTCATQQFTATVANGANTFVDWQVNGVVGGSAATGTITPAGLYTAPATVPRPAQVTITAESQADPTKTASAVVTVNAQTTPPTKGSLESGIAFLTRSRSGTFSQSGRSAPTYLSLQGYTNQLKPLILVQSATVQHVLCTGSGPGIAHQQILYGTISGGNFSGWQAVALSQNDQQNQSATLDSQGQVHLVWREAAPGQPSVVYYAIRAPGGVWSKPEQLSTPGLYADTPTVSVDGQYVRTAWVEWQPGFTNSVGQVNNGLNATAFNDTHVVEGSLMFSMKAVGSFGATFSLPVAVNPGRVVGYPTFSQGAANAVIWTEPSSTGAAAWSVSVGETP